MQNTLRYFKYGSLKNENLFQTLNFRIVLTFFPSELVFIRKILWRAVRNVVWSMAWFLLRNNTRDHPNIILRQHIFGLFLTHPPYVSINSTERQQKFLTPLTQSLWWRNIGMVT